MWRLIKYELKYNNISLIGASLISLQLLMYLVFSNYDKINILLFVLVIILLTSILIGRNQEKIERQNCTLPLSMYSLGLSRTIFLLILWMIIIVGFYLSNYILLPSTFPYVDILMGQFSFALILFFTILFIQDIYYVTVRSKRILKYAGLLLVIFLILCLTLMVFISADLIDPKLQKGYGVLFLYGWGIALSFLSVISFAKRKFYL